MLYLCLAMILDISMFTMGLTMSIIDVNKYNFGLYLVLMSVVTFSLLVALWVAKPKFCRTPPWAIHLYHGIVKSSRPNYQNATGENENLMEQPNADEIMRSIKGIPLLIQAIQYSLEAGFVAGRDSITAGPTITDSAIDSGATTREYYPNATTISSDQSSTMDKAELLDETKDAKWIKSDKKHPRNRVSDMKRQSIFVVFPYSETVPIDQSQLHVRMRRSSSDQDLEDARRKSSFERFCTAAISGENRCVSSAFINEERPHANNDKRKSSPLLKVDTVKRELRRPSIEVRYVGLQNMILAKMSAKQNSS